MSGNMELWGKVEKTPKELIGQIILDDGTVLKTVPSINRVKKATEMFGVYGKKWGLKDIKHSEQRINNGLMLGMVDAVFFVDSDTCQTEFQITNSISIITVVEGKLSVNPTYRKAIETDTINKALSRLGFNADIYSDDELVKTETEVEDDFAGMELIDMNKGGESEQDSV